AFSRVAPSFTLAAIFPFAQHVLSAVWDQPINQILYDRTPHEKTSAARSQRYNREVTTSARFVFLHRGMVSQSGNDSVGYVLRERFRVSRSHPFSLQLGESEEHHRTGTPLYSISIGPTPMSSFTKIPS